MRVGSLYIDPSAVSIALTSIGGIVIAVGATVFLWYNKMKKKFADTFHIDENANKEVEPELIVYDLDENGNRVEYKSTPENEQKNVFSDFASLQAEKESKKTDGSNKFQFHKKRLLPAILCAILLPFMIFVEVPFEIFASNMEEFQFGLGDFLPLSALFGLLTSVVLFLILSLIPEKAYHITGSVLLGLAVLAFLQGNFFNGDLSSLQGDNMAGAGWTNGTAVWNLILWIFILAVFVVAGCFARKIQPISFISLILTVAILGSQLVGFASVSLTTENVFLSKTARRKLEDPEYSPYSMDYKPVTNISKTRNIYYFCVDRFDELYAEKAYAEVEGVFDCLDGFTWYRDDISEYGHTYPAIASMLTGVKYDESKTRKEYLVSAYNSENQLSALNDEGYEINLYTQPFYVYESAFDLPDYIGNRVKDHEKGISFKYPDLVGCMLGMGLYRCFPFIAKDTFGWINSAICNSYTNGEEVKSIDTEELFRYIENKNFHKVKDKQFSFIHVEGCHEILCDAEWNEVGDREPNIVWAVQNSLETVNVFLDALRKEGKYEDATIVICGDHASVLYDDGALVIPHTTALFVKKSGDAGTPIQICDKQVSHENIWPTILESEGLTVPQDAADTLDEVPDGNHTRTYQWHTWTGGRLDTYYYEVNGQSKNFDNWHFINKTHYDRFLMD